MRIARPLAAALAATLLCQPLLAAEVPNILPGSWEIKSHAKATGFMPMEDMHNEEVQCLDEGAIRDGSLMSIPLEDGCELTGRMTRRDRARVTWTCDLQGVTTEGRADMEFKGDRSDGTMHMRMVTPMGNLDVNATITARRIGDC